MILYRITIVVSAFLLFLVQPIVAKQILPWFGGTAAVWTVCVVFFQAALLAGYAYAHAIGKLSSRWQARTHGALLFVSLASLPILASPAWKPLDGSDPTWRIAGLLFTTIGLPYFLLSSTSPLIQRWFAYDTIDAGFSEDAKARVYRLFALSNAGSLVGLLCYPFLIEPYAALSVQSWAWSIVYGCFVLACGGCAWRAHRGASGSAQRVTDDPVPPPDSVAQPHRPTIARYVFWLACAALGSTLLLALTNHITQNIASIPFLWVVPLALYLASFIVVFEGRQGRGWYTPGAWLMPMAAAVVVSAWALSAHRGLLSIYLALPIFGVSLFVACVFCHGEVARTKPDPRWLTHFYLCLAAGGALGGLFVALVAPRIFVNYWETPIALFGVALLACWSMLGSLRRGVLPGLLLATIASAAILLAGGGDVIAELRDRLPAAASGWTSAVLIAIAAAALLAATWRRWPVAIVATAVVCTSFYGMKYYDDLSRDTIAASRNFYGALFVEESGTGTEARRDLMHGVILHGAQLREGERRYKPTAYYGATSGVAVALRRLRAADEPIDVGMIGLGAGTLAAWGRTGDRYRIYEINPAVVEIASREFTYLADSRAHIDLVLGDARLAMERELAAGSALLFDVIAVDAFSSDAIPVHLITQEALDVYFRHLKVDGIVAFHVSNRYLQLAPVVEQLAEAAGAVTVNVVDRPTDRDEVSSDWVLVTRNRAFADDVDIRKLATDIPPIVGLRPWTDQSNNLVEILK